jgi:tricorn protease
VVVVARDANLIFHLVTGLPLMPRTSCFLLAALFVGLTAFPAFGQEPIRMARTPDISPDGKEVAFSYLGDIWVVPSIGGRARQVTSHPAHDINPVFSPDGENIAFSSNRHGSYDIYVVSKDGGKPRRLTFDSASELVCSWSPDGKQILFASTKNTEFPPGYELYTVPVEGGMAHRVSAAEGKEGVFSPKGDQIAYVRGPGSWYRKGYRGSSNDDVWICNADGTNNRRLTDFVGQDGSPMWSADGKCVYYVSECHGTPANIVCLPADATNLLASASDKSQASVKPKQITFHKEDGVRRARIGGNGKWIVYECGADLWVVGTEEGSTPRKLAVEVFADDKVNSERVVTFTSGATEFAVSPDEKFVAFAVYGKLFLMPIAPNAKVTQLTDSPHNDHGIAWAPDSSKIVFLSDRTGRDEMWLLEADDPEHPKFTEAHRFKETKLTDTPDAESGVNFAPDGKRVAFLRSGKLWTMKPDKDPKNRDEKVVVNEVEVFDYEWSPDSRWFVYARRDGSFASELYVVPATGPTAGNPARNITRYATYNGDVTWSADGKKLAFRSERRGNANLYVLSLQKQMASGVSEKPPLIPGMANVEFDWDDIHLRARPVTPISAEEAAISPDGSKVAFRASSGREADLWVASTSGGQLVRVTTGNQQPTLIQWSKRKSPLGGTLDLIYFLDGGGHIHLARPGSADSPRSQGTGRGGSRDGGPRDPEPPAGTPRPSGSGGDTAQLPFKIKMTVRAEELYTEMFDQSWRYLAENFYDCKFHDVNWDSVREKYRPLVKHVGQKEDLYALLYLMMGELNASHLGISGFATVPEETTADLGLLFDESYRGKGLKVAEVLKRGPADRRGLKLKAGDYVVAIDGVDVTEKTDLSKLLNGKVDEPVVLQVADSPDADAKARRRVEIQAVSRERVAPLVYDRWVEKNAKRVAELSQGKLGYIHIPSMDEAGMDRFVRALYSDNFDKEAIVLDVRFNGGGFTHDQVLNYLGAHEHTFFKQRDGGEGFVLRPYDRKWTKPVVLLINNRSYSDAEIFPNAFRTLGLGKLVGQPTGGFVIGTAAVRLVDGSVFRIPRIGVFTAKGVNMEKEGVRPDVLVEEHPDQLAKGVDVQLDKAVEVLTEEVAQWKKKAAGATAKAEDGKPAAPVTAAGPPPAMK